MQQRRCRHGIALHVICLLDRRVHVPATTGRSAFAILAQVRLAFSRDASTCPFDKRSALAWPGGRGSGGGLDAASTAAAESIAWGLARGWIRWISQTRCEAIDRHAVAGCDCSDRPHQSHAAHGSWNANAVWQVAIVRVACAACDLPRPAHLCHLASECSPTLPHPSDPFAWAPPPPRYTRSKALSTSAIVSSARAHSISSSRRSPAAVASRRRPAQQIRVHTASAYTHTIRRSPSAPRYTSSRYALKLEGVTFRYEWRPSIWKRDPTLGPLASCADSMQRVPSALMPSMHVKTSSAPSLQRPRSCSRTPGIAAVLLVCHAPGRHPSPGSTCLPLPGVQRVGSSSVSHSQDLSSPLAETSVDAPPRGLLPVPSPCEAEGYRPWSPSACDGFI